MFIKGRDVLFSDETKGTGAVVETKDLTKIVEESGVDRTKAQQVLDQFQGFFAEAAKYEEEVKSISITDASQVAEMKRARDVRLALKDIRCNGENTRKRLKEESLRTGKMIDGFQRILEGIIVPIENDLLEKEKFVERQEQARIAKVKEERESKLVLYEVDLTLYNNLGEMTQAVFDQLLSGSKLIYETRKEQERKAEEERIAKEQADAIEREKMRAENERLKQEAAAREAEVEKERKKLEKERQRKEAELQAERDAREAAEKALRDKQESERKAKLAEQARIETERVAKEEEAKRLAKAGDKGLILAYIDQVFAISQPSVKSTEANAILSTITTTLSTARANANTKL
ncbi:MAG: hypothetical protein PHX80_04140 [Candidatus Nanoarchaeia archaeon]|nr:hypothetical protein [Candidatus Nanoarchaeia archaeon]